MPTIPEIVFKPLTSLLFDPENPRLPTSVNGKNEKEVLSWMLENENVLELMASIAEKGYFSAEPLLVVPSNKNGKFEVVEGNRRLTAVKLLKNPDLINLRQSAIHEIINEAKKIDTLDSLPVIIFKTAQEIESYLGYRHITGVQPWDSLAKAKYLRRIQKTLKISNPEKLHKTLAKIIGSRADHVKLLMAGLDVYDYIEENSFFGIKNLDERNIKFGVLYTAINNPEIAHFIGVDLDSKKPAEHINRRTITEVTKWMFEENSEGFTRVGESRNLRLLGKVVANEKALKAFRNQKSLSDAVLLTDEPQEIFKVSLQESLSKLQTARDYIHLVSDVSSKDQDTIIEISQLSKSLSATLKAKLSESEDE